MIINYELDYDRERDRERENYLYLEKLNFLYIFGVFIKYNNIIGGLIG